MLVVAAGSVLAVAAAGAINLDISPSESNTPVVVACFVQGTGTPRSLMLERFKEDVDSVLFGTDRAGTWFGGSQCWYDHPPLMRLTIIEVTDRLELEIANRTRHPAWHGEVEDNGRRYVEIVIGSLTSDPSDRRMSVS